LSCIDAFPFASYCDPRIVDESLLSHRILLQSSGLLEFNVSIRLSLFCIFEGLYLSCSFYENVNVKQLADYSSLSVD
jgi:hypothetical protein